jgi:hypothetical protein
MTGLQRLRHSFCDRPKLSLGGVAPSSTVSLSSNKTFALRIRTTGPYVSFSRVAEVTAAMPDAIAIIMKTHLNPIVCIMKPPATGPREGASRGPSEYIAIALALSRSENKSETKLPPMVAVDPPNPARNRKAISDPTVGEKAQPRLQTTIVMFPTSRTQTRPHISDNGAAISEQSADERR